jgi:hypothetical protein
VIDWRGYDRGKAAAYNPSNRGGCDWAGHPGRRAAVSPCHRVSGPHFGQSRLCADRCAVLLPCLLPGGPCRSPGLGHHEHGRQSGRCGPPISISLPPLLSPSLLSSLPPSALLSCPLLSSLVLSLLLSSPPSTSFLVSCREADCVIAPQLSSNALPHVSQVLTIGFSSKAV